jgi:hypothetical protein
MGVMRSSRVMEKQLLLIGFNTRRYSCDSSRCSPTHFLRRKQAGRRPSCYSSVQQHTSTNNDIQSLEPVRRITKINTTATTQYHLIAAPAVTVLRLNKTGGKVMVVLFVCAQAVRCLPSTVLLCRFSRTLDEKLMSIS